MDIRALLFDVNGTLIDIETDEGLEEIYRAIGHFLMYQGISLHRWEVRDLYFQIMQRQRTESRRRFARVGCRRTLARTFTEQGEQLYTLITPGKARATSTLPGRTAPWNCA